MAKNTKAVGSFCFQMFSHYCDSVVALFLLILITQQAFIFARCGVQVKTIQHDTHLSPFI